jgi:DNA-binding transcriptional LysR family regulator
MDRLNSMRVFARVVDEGSFANAARELNMSPAVVSRLVVDLEEHLGTRLINRTTRRMALTETGSAYLARVRQILADLDEADAVASNATSELRGHLRVLAPPAFTVHQIAKHLPKFRALYPNVTLELSVSGPVATVDENFDVSIIWAGLQPLDGDFVARRLARAEVILCASPEYLDKRGRPKHPDDLDHHDILISGTIREVTFHRAPCPYNNFADEEVTRTPSRRTLDTQHEDTRYAAALAGLGVTGLASFMVEDALLEQALERVLPGWRLFSGSIYAAVPTRKHLPARTKAFMDFLIQTFGGEDRDPWLQAAGCES